MLLRLVPLGNVPSKMLEELSSELRDLVRMRCKILSPVTVPKEAFNQWRKQYDAEKILAILSNNPETRFIDASIPTLVVTNEDIYYKGLRFIFGLEEPLEGTLMVSLARLKPEFYDERPNPFRLTERVIKESMHEIGHYVGLDHCRHPWCIMSFSSSVNEIDKKRKEFCKDCNIKMAVKGVNLE